MSPELFPRNEGSGRRNVRRAAQPNIRRRDDDNTSRPFLTMRTLEESMYLLTLLLQPSSLQEPEFNFSNQDQRPVLATATQNYGAIGKPTPPDSNVDVAPHQGCRKRIYKQVDTFHEYPDLDTVVYFKQRKGGITLAESAVGRKKTFIEPILKVTTAKSSDPVIFKDPLGNLIEVSPLCLLLYNYLWFLGKPSQASDVLRVEGVLVMGVLLYRILILQYHTCLTVFGI
jgi:hypothetical protein